MSRFKDIKIPISKRIFIFVSNSIRILSGGDRIKRLSEIMIKTSKEIYLKEKKKITILDFGCGSMEISKKLENLIFIKEIIGVDTFKNNFKTKKMKYIQYNEFFKKNKKKFDLIIAVDVLHHIGVENSHIILKKLSKISKNIVIKDHFEHGFFSRQLLRFVDFYANYGYDIVIPKYYFNYSSWKKTIKKTNLREIKILKSFQQHDGIFNIILNKKHHFVSFLKNVKR
tara:strand:- start:160 stop:840 length:681 start_codon:yes stop_codon:yes gene_type:complete